MRVFYISLIVLFVAGCGTESEPDGGTVPAPEDVTTGGSSDKAYMSVPDPGESYLYEPVTRELSWEETDYLRKLSTTVSRGEIYYTIAFTETKFEESEHVIEFELYGTVIDGRVAHGVDGGTVPRWELSKIEVEFEGRVIQLPEELYNDCYEFWLDRFADCNDTYIAGIILRILDDGVLQVSALASDAAGTYLVHWWFGGDQPAVRHIPRTEAEMHAFDENWKTQIPLRPPFDN